MKHKSTPQEKSRSSNVRYRQVLLVCFAFTLMIAISFTATNIILRSHLAYEAQELLRVAELTIKSNLREALTALVDSSFTILGATAGLCAE